LVVDVAVPLLEAEVRFERGGQLRLVADEAELGEAEKLRC
jgi:hypothetical protein